MVHLYVYLGVSIHWTRLLDWNTELDYWTVVYGIIQFYGVTHVTLI